MGMSIGQSGSDDPEEIVDINTTPLIDVMLVLLIMLIITIPVQTHAVKMDMPSANQAPPSAPPPVVNIEIDFDGTILWDGNPIPDRGTLESRMSQAAALDPQPEVHIRPDKLAEYKYVAEVLAEAQSIGLHQIGIIGNEQFIQ